MVLRSLLASLLLLQIVPHPDSNPSLGELPGIINNYGSTCAAKSRTFLDAADQYFTNPDGSHAALEIGTDDFALAMWLRQDNAFTSYWYRNTNAATTQPGIRFQITATGSLAVTAYRTDAGSFTSSSANGAITIGLWAYVVVHGDRSGNMEIYINGVQADLTPADISAAVAQDWTNTVAASIAQNTIDGRLAISAFWKGTIGINVPTLTQLGVTDYQGGTPVVDCSHWTVTPTACWMMNGAAGSNELDQIGTVDLTQVNSPGADDGIGPGCN